MNVSITAWFAAHIFVIAETEKEKLLELMKMMQKGILIAFGQIMMR